MKDIKKILQIGGICGLAGLALFFGIAVLLEQFYWGKLPTDTIQDYLSVLGTPDLACMYLKSDDPDIRVFRKAYTKDQIEAYLLEVGRFDAIHFIRAAAPKSILFQFARFERFFGEADMLRYADEAGEPKTVIFYNTGHELNDHQAFIDRALWLKREVGMKALPEINRIRNR